MSYVRILEEISRHMWAISHPAIDAILRIVTVGEQLEERSIFHGSLISVEQRKDEIEAQAGEADSETYRYGERYKSMGIIHIDGPVIPRAGMQSVSQPRLTTSAGILSDLYQMEADQRIDRIALMIDSPGGAVTGTSELAAAIAESKKPVVSYIEGMGASAMYWVPSASQAIVANQTAQVGSVGVVAKIEAEKNDKIRKFVSTQSPEKHADPESESGAKGYQRMVDDLADVFINSVAANRGTTREDVLENYGQGGIVIASRAEAKGMVDAVMTRAQFIRDFSGDLEACSWLRKGRSRKSLRAQAEFDNEKNLSRQLAEETAQAEIKMEDFQMNLTELLETDATAKAEFKALVAKAVEEDRAVFLKGLEKPALIAAGNEYPQSVRNVAAEVITGKKKIESLDAVMSVVEMKSEQEKSEEAKKATEKTGATASQIVEGKSQDGKIRTQADIEARLFKKEVK